MRNVSLKIHGGEKIGICGRTGAGKSTFVSLLFRFAELAENPENSRTAGKIGNVFIDGIDISGIPLSRLRKGISVIPQEPVIFKGTIRFFYLLFNDQ